MQSENDVYGIRSAVPWVVTVLVLVIVLTFCVALVGSALAGPEVVAADAAPVLDQVIVAPGSVIAIRYLQGANGLWYGFCTEGCDRVVTWGTVDELTQGFVNYYDMMNHWAILRARAYGTTPILIPGTGPTPQP